MKGMSELSKRNKELILNLLRNIEDLKTIVAPLLEGQDHAQRVLQIHTDTLGDLIDDLVTVKKDADLIRTDLSKVKVHLGDHERLHLELRSRLRKAELRPLLKIYEKARAVEKIGNSELQRLELSAKKEPENTDLWLILGIVYYQNDQYTKALGCFDKVNEINPEDGHAWCWKGLSQRELRKYDDAIESFEMAAKHVVCPTIFRFEAFSRMQLDQKEKALELINQAIQGDKSDAVSWGFKGHILEELDKHMEALGCLEKSLELDPNLVHALNERGIILSNLGPDYYEEALNTFDKATKLEPDSYWLWLNKGKTLSKLERDVEAIESYDKAMELNPKNPCIYCLKGISQNLLGRDKEAMENFDAALKIGLSKECKTYYYNMATVLRNLKRYEDALRVVEQSIAVKSDDVDSWILKTSILEKLSEYEDALEAVEKAITIKSDSPRLWITKAFILLSAGREDEEVEKCIRTAVQFPITDAESLNNLAWLLYRWKDYSTALRYASEAVDNEPNNAHYLDTLACIYYELGDCPKSLQVFEKAIDLRKGDEAISWSILAKLYEEMGKIRESKKIKERYLE